MARLHLRPEVRASIQAEMGEGKIRYQLHPPILRALGMKRKLSLGPWVESLFRLLVAMRRLRGTGLDPFGYARVRRVERALVDEYRAMVERALASLGPETPRARGADRAAPRPRPRLRGREAPERPALPRGGPGTRRRGLTRAPPRHGPPPARGVRRGLRAPELLPGRLGPPSHPVDRERARAAPRGGARHPALRPLESRDGADASRGAPLRVRAADARAPVTGPTGRRRLPRPGHRDPAHGREHHSGRVRAPGGDRPLPRAASAGRHHPPDLRHARDRPGCPRRPGRRGGGRARTPGTACSRLGR